MATYIERTSPVYEHRDTSGVYFVVGLIVLLAALFLIFYYGLPVLRTMGTNQINVPDKINVNVNTPNQGAQPAQNAPAPQQ